MNGTHEGATVKVTLTPENVFTLVVGTRSFPGMRKVSEWEGFTKLEGPAGIAILHDSRGPMARLMADALGGDPIQWTVVMASPEIGAALLTETPLGGAAPGPVVVHAHWPDGRYEEHEFDHWPARDELPATAVRFDIAWPDLDA